jgi:hypothetical protein
MTTKHSPLRVLKSQADEIARRLVAFERGEITHDEFHAKLLAARKADSLKLGIFMDDKLITVEIAWATIKATGEVAMSEYILKLMREQRDTVH